MYTKKMMREAVQEFQDFSWGEYYETAPSEACKDRIAFMFCFSRYGDEGYFKDPEEFKRERDKLEARLDLADWQHLLKCSGKNQWSTKCRSMVEKLQAEQDTRVAAAM